MKLFKRAKDGGPQSHVTGYWLAEIKSFASVVLLHFANGSRDAYHSHAFDSVSWVLRGELQEFTQSPTTFAMRSYRPSLRPVITRRSTFHRVVSVGDSWVLSLRGPWAKTWQEWDPKHHMLSTLSHGRFVLGAVRSAIPFLK